MLASAYASGPVMPSLRPESSVLNLRPSAVVTIAERASVAVIAVASTRGKSTLAKVAPSAVTSTTPSLPMSQQIVPEGDTPPVSDSIPTARTGNQDAP